MKYDLRNCTLNGVAIESIIRDADVQELKSNHQNQAAQMAFVVSKSRHTVSKFRNTSGARSGKGRVIFTAGGQA